MYGRMEAEWSALDSCRFTPGGKSPLFPFERRMSGSHNCEDRNLLALPGIKFLSLGRPAHSPSLYRFVILTYSFRIVYRKVKETCINLITAHLLSPFISHNTMY
jgi:hypothetical protein